MMKFKPLPSEIEISAFGAPLSEQLDGCFDEKSLDRYDLISRSLTVCLFHSVITRSDVNAGRKKLVRLIAKEWKENDEIS